MSPRGEERARPPVLCHLGCVTQVTMRRQSVTPVTSPRDNDSSHSLPCVSPGPQSLSSQIVFGSDSLRPSASFDSLGTLYDARWAPKMRPPFVGAKVSRITVYIIHVKSFILILSKTLSVSVRHPEALSVVRQENAGGCDVYGELLQPEGGET